MGKREANSQLTSLNPESDNENSGDENVNWKASEAKIANRQISKPRKKMTSSSSRSNLQGLFGGVPLQPSVSNAEDKQKLFHRHVKSINVAFLKKLGEETTKNPFADVSKYFDSYKKHFDQILIKFKDCVDELKSLKSMNSTNKQLTVTSIPSSGINPVANQSVFKIPSPTLSPVKNSSIAPAFGTSGYAAEQELTIGQFQFDPTTPSFTFGAAEAVGNETSSTTVESTATSVSFGIRNETKKKGTSLSVGDMKDSSFVFGSKSDFDSSTSVLGATETKTSVTVQPFSFGSPDATPSTNLGFGKPDATPSTNLGFGKHDATPSTNLGFGKPDATPSTNVGFGKPDATPSTNVGFGKPDATPSTNVGFGKPDATPSTTKADAIPSFSFGSGTVGANSVGVPSFSFGSKIGSTPSTTLGVDSTPSFSFGAKTDSNSSFTFGASTSATPSFSFGSKIESTPSTSFVANATPSFSFGAKTDSTPTTSFAANATPSFSFGAKTDTNTSFTFVPQSTPFGQNTLPVFAAKKGDDEGDDDAIPEGEEGFSNKRTNDELVKTGKGEEDEESLVEERCKLYTSSESGWTDYGICICKVNLNKITSKKRLLCRAEGSGKVMLNVFISGIIFKDNREKKHIVITSFDENKNASKYLVRAKSEEIIDKITKAME